MRLHVLVEGESEEALLNGWLPRFLPPGHSFTIIRHRGKGRLPRDPVRVPDIRREGLLDRSPSFRQLCRGLLTLAGEPAE